MARKDDHPDDVEVRWDPAYSCTDFVPDREKTYSDLAASYHSIAAAASNAHGYLKDVIPASWSGEAAKACGGYIDDLAKYIDGIAKSVGAANSAAKTAQGSVADAVSDADKATSKANSAQDLHRRMDQDRDDNWLNYLNPVNTYHEDQATWDLGQAVRAGNDARGDAMTANKTLMKNLDAPDHDLSTKQAPQPPNPLGMSNPDQAELLAGIMQPVAAAMAEDGDTKRANDAVSEYERELKAHPDKAKQILAKYAKILSPAEFNYMLDHIDEDDLAAGFDKMDPTKDRDLYNAIAAKANSDVLSRLGDTDPNHYWHPAVGGDQYVWENDGFGNGPLDGDPNDVRQGALGDCHDLSALAAVEQAHPGYLESHITRNANGTYTVTLYKDGEPVQVTVTPDVPFMTDSNGTPTGSAYTHGGPHGPTVYQIYEKALAQSNAEFGVQDGSGYDSLNGGSPSRDMSVITGHGGSYHESGDASPQQLADDLANGKPVTADTPEFDSNPTPKSPDGHDQEIIGGHAYRVVSVDPAHSTVTLANPWDPTAAKNGTVTITWDEFQKYYSGVDVGSQP